MLYSSIATGVPRAEHVPALATQFAGALPVGYGARSTGVSAGLSVTHTSVDRDGRPNTGGVRRMRVA